MSFLYEVMTEEFGKRYISEVELPTIIKNNLNKRFEIRPYQKEAFQRFILFFNNSFENKQNPPFHLLFNMATGSGKTLIMAGLIIYLYEKGYRNFIFTASSTNIIEKTKDNFLNSYSSKFLFSDYITCDNKNIKIKEVDSFETADRDNINICFTTIHQLHIDLNCEKENSLSFEDFKQYDICLLADEAHHFNTSTRNGQGELFESWENTIIKILEQNYKNILLEFTATIDYEHKNIIEKYKPKVIYRYDLKQFRSDGYSKEVTLLRSDLNDEDRILQAVIINQYRQEVASKYGINLKPVILFKAKKTIAESIENETLFQKIIENLTVKKIEDLLKRSKIEILHNALLFFTSNNITKSTLVQRIKQNFAPEYCLNVNEENIDKKTIKASEKETILKQENILNSLEEQNNPIRAIFAVQKLNEGWDVLNLFDIVRLYSGRDSKGDNIGKTTISEAQLIGRGARYFPFVTENDKDKFKRKYDFIHHDLKLIEELHYHTIEDNRYISELKKALIKEGIYDDENDLIEKTLILKEDFKKSNFYKSGVVFYNRRAENDYKKINSFNDLGVKKKNSIYELYSGSGIITQAFLKETSDVKETIESRDIKLSEIPIHIIKNALSSNPFFYFSNLKTYFPNIKSTLEFISENKYFGNLSITIRGTKNRLNEITNEDLYFALLKLMKEIESEIKSNLSEYIATDFNHYPLINTFVDKTIKIRKDDERIDGQEQFLSDKSWYVFNANHGTSEEKAFVEMFARRYEHIEKDFNNIYLIRNERVVKVYDKKARAFEPDFLLFLKQKKGNKNVLQIFIEPKGAHLLDKDKWKEEFLNELREEKKTISLITDKYRITGVPFYNNKNENDFIVSLEKVLNE